MADHSIELTPAKQADGTIQWTMDYQGKKGSQPSDYPLIDLPKDSGSHKLTYTINNPAGLSINFDPAMVPTGSGQNIHNAIWIQQDTKPTTPVLDAQIRKVTVNTTDMTVKDKNSGDPLILKYRINFVDAANPGAKVSPLDPEIKNGGGHNLLQDYGTIAAVIVALAIAVLVARRFLGPRE